MSEDKKIIWWYHRVYYAETDAMGVVYYGNYFEWFEQARDNYLRNRGMSYAEVEERGIFLPVTETFCRYLYPARYDEEIKVKTWVKKVARASIVFGYEVYNLTSQDKLMTQAETTHACVNKEGKITRIPRWLLEIVS